jgi:hypothetical protein
MAPAASPGETTGSRLIKQCSGDWRPVAWVSPAAGLEKNGSAALFRPGSSISLHRGPARSEANRGLDQAELLPQGPEGRSTNGPSTTGRAKERRGRPRHSPSRVLIPARQQAPQESVPGTEVSNVAKGIHRDECHQVNLPNEGHEMTCRCRRATFRERGLCSAAGSPLATTCPIGADRVRRRSRRGLRPGLGQLEARDLLSRGPRRGSVSPTRPGTGERQHPGDPGAY